MVMRVRYPGGAPAALGLAAAVMTGLDPGILYDVSFQLSFASVAGLMVLQPPLQRWGERVMPEGRPLLSLVRPLFNALAAGLAAILFTPGTRLARLTRGWSWRKRLATVAWVPVIRVTGDIAKMLGYPVGVAWRRKNRS